MPLFLVCFFVAGMVWNILIFFSLSHLRSIVRAKSGLQNASCAAYRLTCPAAYGMLQGEQQLNLI